MNEPPAHPTPAKPTRSQIVFFGVIFGISMAVGRIAGDGVRESLGWWGSMAVGTLATIVGAFVGLIVAQAWQRWKQPRSTP
jgi:uncharacterized membrane protein HdeD (DUF308 family)